MIKNKNIIADLVSIRIELTQTGKTQECNACGHGLETDDNYCSSCGAWQEK